MYGGQVHNHLGLRKTFSGLRTKNYPYWLIFDRVIRKIKSGRF